MEGLDVSYALGLARMISGMFQVILTILLGTILGVAGVNLLNTMMMTVLERQKEIGVLMALGLPRRLVVRVSVLEALFFGIVGSAIGAALGSAVARFWLVEHGIHLGASTTRKMSVAIGENIRGVLTVEGVPLAVGVGLFVAFFGSLWPALKASRVHPVEAMRKTR